MAPLWFEFLLGNLIILLLIAMSQKTCTPQNICVLSGLMSKLHDFIIILLLLLTVNTTGVLMLFSMKCFGWAKKPELYCNYRSFWKSWKFLLFHVSFLLWATCLDQMFAWRKAFKSNLFGEKFKWVCVYNSF